MVQPIGILGGTFDPVHHGHLRLALECVQNLGLAEVRLVPVYAPPHKAAPVATPSQRLHMLQLAVEGAAGLVADDREVRRGGSSYTIDTLTTVRAEFGNRPVCLLMGMDAFQALHTWREWTALLDHVHIIVVNRTGSAVEFEHRELANLLAARSVSAPSELIHAPGGAILKIDVPTLDISASRIRGLIAAGRDVTFLLPGNVIEYIRREGLYRGKA